MQKISEREQIQNSLVDIFAAKGLNTSPLGNDTSLAKFGKGKRRVVNFGLARYLDARAIIYQPNLIEIRAEGPLAYKYRGIYKSVDEIRNLVRV